jgi:hypothetical protein
MPAAAEDSSLVLDLVEALDPAASEHLEALVLDVICDDRLLEQLREASIRFVAGAAAAAAKCLCAGSSCD